MFHVERLEHTPERLCLEVLVNLKLGCAAVTVKLVLQLRYNPKDLREWMLFPLESVPRQRQNLEL